MDNPKVPQIPAIPAESPAIQAPKLAALPAPDFDNSDIVEKRAKKVAKALKRYLRSNPSQKLEIDGNKYPRIEAWQFVAALSGHTAMVSRTEEIIDDRGQQLGFIAVAHTVNAQGRVVSSAEAACMREEGDWQNSPAFQIRSMSQTRACAKALRNVFAYVMVMAGLCGTPAEEMPSQNGSHDLPAAKCYECGNGVSAKRSVKTKKAFGKTLCLDCEKKEQAHRGEQLMAPINDPAMVQKSIDAVRERKAAQGQPIVALLDHEDEVAGYGV
jgi:ssDNA-binding Zn-finger/Zn-ribbon topoisomerase 1